MKTIIDYINEVKFGKNNKGKIIKLIDIISLWINISVQELLTKRGTIQKSALINFANCASSYDCSYDEFKNELNDNINTQVTLKEAEKYNKVYKKYIFYEVYYSRKDKNKYFTIELNKDDVDDLLNNNHITESVFGKNNMQNEKEKYINVIKKYENELINTFVKVKHFNNLGEYSCTLDLIEELVKEIYGEYTKDNLIDFVKLTLPIYYKAADKKFGTTQYNKVSEYIYDNTSKIKNETEQSLTGNLPFMYVNNFSKVIIHILNKLIYQ